MTKESVLENIEDTLKDIYLKKDIINRLPTGSYISLTGLEYFYDRSTGKSKSREFHAFVKPVSYNKDSVRARVIASDALRLRGDPVAIPYLCIGEWEPLKIEDLPKAMSWPHKYPLYEKMLRERKITVSGRVDVLSMKDFKVSSELVNGTWWRYLMSCPVCGKELRLYNTHTHRCSECGYTFKTKENVQAFLKEKQNG
jgi:ribosomal protein L37E